VRGPGVVTGRYGTLGEVFYIREDFWPHNTTLFVKDFHGNSPRFVYYLLKNANLGRHNSATGVPGVNRNVLHKLEVSVPPVPAQEGVVDVLSCLDDKIDCNRRINDLLLRVARALFQHWFVDFGPFQKRGLQDSDIGPIPKGWSVRSLYESAQYLNGAAFKKHDFAPSGTGLPVIKISELKGGIVQQTRWCARELDPRFRITDGDILFSWSGSPETSIDIFLWAAGDAWLNQHTFRVVPHRPIERPFVFSLLKHLKPVFVRLASNKQTTGLGHVTVGDMKRLPVLVPPDNVLTQFNEYAGPWLDQILANLKENQILARTRDYLLPKLLSGEVEVKAVEGTP
jgi:type I restriction enzyme, S subunit